MLALLRRRDFALLWFGGLVSAGGDRVLQVALPYYVYQRTGSTVATAGMIVATLAPSVLVSTFAGVFVDRWDRRRVLVATNLLQGAAVALLLAVPADGWLWVVYAVAAVQSVLASFAQPAEAALLPTLVADDELVAANALNALNNRLARLVGAPLGGALLAYLGLRAVVLVDVATFLAPALMITRMTAPTRSARPGRDAAAAAQSAWASFWNDWLAGLRIMRRERSIAVLFFVFGLMTFGGTMLDPLTVAWVRDVLGAGPQVYAWLAAVHAVTGIVGTVLIGRFAASVTPRALIGWSSLAAGAALAVKHNVPLLPLALAMAAVGGLTSVASSVGVDTLAQRAVSDEYRGRVFGALVANGALLSLLGALTAGVVAEAVAIVPVLNLATALIVVAGVVAFVAFAPRRERTTAPAPAVSVER